MKTALWSAVFAALFVCLLFRSPARVAASDPPPVAAVYVNAGDVYADDEPDDAGDEYIDRWEYATRAPVGHTHTCPSGHTWDHSANPSHACEICGATQYVQDARPRPVTVRVRQRVKIGRAAPALGASPRVVFVRRVHVDPPPVATALVAPYSVRPVSVPAPVVPLAVPAPVFAYPYAEGGCPNGQCESGVQRTGPIRTILRRVIR